MNGVSGSLSHSHCNCVARRLYSLSAYVRYKVCEKIGGCSGHARWRRSDARRVKMRCVGVAVTNRRCAACGDMPPQRQSERATLRRLLARDDAVKRGSHYQCDARRRSRQLDHRANKERCPPFTLTNLADAQHAGQKRRPLADTSARPDRMAR